MKRIVSLLLVFLFLAGSVASAEVPDLTAMTLDELVELHKAVCAEIDARLGSESSTIASGVYVAGQSIVPGAYLITCIEAYDNKGMSIQIFEDGEKYKEYLKSGDYWYAPGYQLYSGHITVNQTATIILTEGMLLVINGGVGNVQTVKPDWAP